MEFDELDPIADEYADDEMFVIEQPIKVSVSTKGQQQTTEYKDPITNWEIGIIISVVVIPFVLAAIAAAVQNR